MTRRLRVENVLFRAAPVAVVVAVTTTLAVGWLGKTDEIVSYRDRDYGHPTRISAEDVARP